jgi:CO dehydrogenase maturation factor
MFAVVEPGTRSVQTVHAIHKLAQGLGIESFWVVGNKVRHERDEAFIRDSLNGLSIVGMLPYSDQAIEADIQNKALFDVAPEMAEKTREIVAAVL